MARFTHIKLILSGENRTGLINYVALDSYPGIHKLDIQCIFHKLSKFENYDGRSNL